ncbi:MAG: branched-chain amino acid ABC transporter permease [Gammaproteobacteria bacterium]|nr:branched-chain amino acid ABC transporter permease [Gammaproteobacteria bacterium]
MQILIDAPIFSVQLLLDGLLIGAIFALVAYGLALEWGVTNIINIAQGDLVILGGYVALTVYHLGVHPLFGVPIAAAVLFCVGWLIYRTVLFRVIDRDLFTSILATFGISILLQQLIDKVYGADVQTAEANLGTLFLFDNQITLSNIKLVAFVVVLACGGLLLWFLKRSRTGQAIRATAQNARAARIMGIDTEHVYSMTVAINAAICGAAGALVVMVWVIQPFIGLAYTIRSFMIVVVAGIGNLGGVLAAGMGLGVAEQFAGFLLGAEFQIGFVFALLVVILVVRNLRLARKREYLH